MKLLCFILFTIISTSLAVAQQTAERTLPRQAGPNSFTEYINALSRASTDCDRTAHMEIPCLKRDVRSRLREVAEEFEFDAEPELQHYLIEYSVDHTGKLNGIYFYDEKGLTNIDAIKEYLLNMDPIPRKQLTGDPTKVKLANFGVVDYMLVREGRLVIPD